MTARGVVGVTAPLARGKRSPAGRECASTLRVEKNRDGGAATRVSGDREHVIAVSANSSTSYFLARLFEKGIWPALRQGRAPRVRLNAYPKRTESSSAMWASDEPDRSRKGFVNFFAPQGDFYNFSRRAGLP